MNKPKLTTVQSTSKLAYLDGIRGLMALNVVISHFTIVFFPQMQLSAYSDSMGGVLSLFAKTPLSILVNGNIAVQYFFVLTGFLIGRSFFTRPISPNQILVRSVNRYLRLLPVVLISTIVTFFTMQFDLQYHFTINHLLINKDFLPAFCNFEPTIPSLLVNIFVYPFIRNSAYVGPFWTIRYEFFGYILAMLVCHLFRESHFRRLGYAITAILCFSQISPNYVPFIFGVFIADLQFNDIPDICDVLVQKVKGQPISIFIALILGLYLACCPLYFATIYTPLSKIPKITPDLIRAAGVTLLLYALLYLPKAQRVFSTRFFLFLGRVSFPVYAIHWTLMLTLQSWLFYVLIHSYSYTISAILAFSITLPVIYILAYILWYVVEKDKLFDLTRLSKFFSKKCRS